MADNGKNEIIGGSEENTAGNNDTVVVVSGNNETAVAEDINYTNTNAESNLVVSNHFGSVNEEDGGGIFTWLREAG